jgi:hypothetical protein
METIINKEKVQIIFHENFYFDLILSSNMTNSFEYFINSSIIKTSEKNYDFYYYKLPFLLIKKLIDTIKKGAFITKSIFISKDIW